MSRLPIRIRLTLPFALAMALVLAALGSYVYLRVGSTLLSSTDQSLLAQATEATLRIDRGRTPLDLDAPNGARFAQVLDSSGRVVLSQPTVLPPLLSPAQARRVAGGGSMQDELLDRRGERTLAPARRSGHGGSLPPDTRRRELARCAQRVARAVAQGASRRLAARAPARNAGRLRPRRCCAPSRRGDATQSGEHLGRDAGQPASGAPRERRGSAARRDAQRHARPPRDRLPA